MKVSSVTARFLRRVQVQNFEPAEAELSITLGTVEGETQVDAKDAQPLMELALKQAKTAVLKTLIDGIKESAAPQVRPTTAPVAAPATPPADPAPAAGTKPKETKAKDAKPKEPAATTADIPDGTAPATPAPAPKPAANADIPAVEAKTVDAPTKTMTPTELSAWIAENIKAKKLTTADMRDLMTEYKIIRLGELAPPQVLEFKAKLEKVIADRKE